MKNTKEIFDNNYIISEIKKHTTHKSIKIINELKKILTNEILTTIYNKSISIHQSNINKNGSYLEKIISRELENNSVQYKQQVTIDKNGIIINFNNKRNKCYHIIDFIIGENIEIGKSITNYKIISCKTTCRERWTQDNWTLNYKPKKYILLTTSNDYPTSERFNENINRKIITSLPKKNDNRIYKLNFVDELK